MRNVPAISASHLAGVCLKLSPFLDSKKRAPRLEILYYDIFFLRRQKFPLSYSKTKKLL